MHPKSDQAIFPSYRSGRRQFTPTCTLHMLQSRDITQQERGQTPEGARPPLVLPPAIIVSAHQDEAADRHFVDPSGASTKCRWLVGGCRLLHACTEGEQFLLQGTGSRGGWLVVVRSRCNRSQMKTNQGAAIVRSIRQIIVGHKIFASSQPTDPRASGWWWWWWYGKC